jgi:cell division protein FtsX
MALPAILGMFGSGIGLFAGYAVTKVLVALGLSYVVYQGIDVLFESAEAQIYASFGALPADLYGFLLLCGVDVAITILMSAFAAKLLLAGFQAGSKAVLGYKVN